MLHQCNYLNPLIHILDQSLYNLLYTRNQLNVLLVFRIKLWFLQLLSYLDFLTYFYALLGYYCIPTIKLYNETKIDENTLNGILNGKIQPQRDDLIQMSLVLNIDLKKTNFMLSLAECETLSYKESRDSLIICSIKNHYSINKTNIMLSTCNLVKI